MQQQEPIASSIKRRIAISSLAVVVLAAAIFGGYRWLRHSELGVLLGLMPPFAAKRAQYGRVLDELHKGTLKTPSLPVVMLPQRYAGLTPRETIYVERRPNGQLLVLFPTWYGRGADLQGYLYTSAPLAGTDFTVRPDGIREISACGFDYLMTEDVQDNWYAVIRRMD